MHEMALCTEVVNTVVATAKENDAASVDKVSMVIGEFRDIIVDMFDSFFHFLTKNTLAEHASVTYTTVPITVMCHNCHQVFPVNLQSKDPVECPKCKARDYEMYSGNEFMIESIEVTTHQELAGRS